MGPGQVAKHVQPSLPPPPPSPPPPSPHLPLPSRRPPVQLCRSPQVPARSDVQHERQHVRSSPLFTGVESSNTDISQQIVNSEWFHCKLWAFWQVEKASEIKFMTQNLSITTQTNEVLLIKHLFSAGFYRLQYRGSSMKKTLCGCTFPV